MLGKYLLLEKAFVFFDKVVIIEEGEKVLSARKWKEQNAANAVPRISSAS